MRHLKKNMRIMFLLTFNIPLSTTYTSHPFSIFFRYLYKSPWSPMGRKFDNLDTSPLCFGAPGIHISSISGDRSWCGFSTGPRLPMPLVVEEMPPETIGGSGETHFPSGKPLKQKPCLHGWPMVKQPFLGSVVATGKTKKSTSAPSLVGYVCWVCRMPCRSK